MRAFVEAVVDPLAQAGFDEAQSGQADFVGPGIQEFHKLKIPGVGEAGG